MRGSAGIRPLLLGGRALLPPQRRPASRERLPAPAHQLGVRGLAAALLSTSPLVLVSGIGGPQHEQEAPPAKKNRWHKVNKKDDDPYDATVESACMSEQTYCSAAFWLAPPLPPAPGASASSSDPTLPSIHFGEVGAGKGRARLRHRSPPTATVRWGRLLASGVGLASQQRIRTLTRLMSPTTGKGP